MPYENEIASKASHSDIIENPDVREFLSESNYVREPSDEEIKQLVHLFKLPPDLGQTDLPSHIFAIDGSPYESQVDDRLPSTKVGYLKVSTIHISMDEFGALRVQEGRFVDPFRVAKLRRNKDSLLFVVPGANVRWKGYASVRDSFCARVDYERLPDNVVLSVEDEYRYKYIIAGRDLSQTGFGDETYYGQDFLYKTSSGKRFVVGLPYPFSSKRDLKEGSFHEVKTVLSRYLNLGRALELIRNFETDLYANAVIPVALAHHYTAISAMPGGKVLDLLSQGVFPKKE